MFHPYDNKSPSSLTSFLLPQPQKQTGSQSPAVGGTPLDLILCDVIWLCFPVFRERLWNRCHGSSIKHESLQTPSRAQHSSLKRSVCVLFANDESPGVWNLLLEVSDTVL